MLFRRGGLDANDSGEDSIVAKVFAGLLFNPFVPANAGGKYALSRAFLRYFLPELVDGLDFVGVELCIKPSMGWFGSLGMARIKPDVIIRFPGVLAVAFEAKYTQGFGNDQKTASYHKAIENGEVFKADRHRLVCVLMTHQRLIEHIRGGTRGLTNLRSDLLRLDNNLRINTWNCAYEAVEQFDDDSVPGRKQILDYLLRKENANRNSQDGTKRNFVSLVTQDNGKVPTHPANWWRDQILQGSPVGLKTPSQPKLDGKIAIVARFDKIPFRAERNGRGFKGYVLVNEQKKAVLVGETTLRKRYAGVVSPQNCQSYSGRAKIESLKKMLSGYKLIPPCEFSEDGSAS